MESDSSPTEPLLGRKRGGPPLPVLSLGRGFAVRAVVLTVFGGTAFAHGYLIIGAFYRMMPFYAFASGLGLYFLDVFFGKAERNPRREWPWFRDSFVTKAPIEYFGMKTLVGDDVKLEADQQYLFVLHPHGIFPYGGLSLYAGASPLLKRFPGLRVHPCGATVCFKVPFIREYLLWTGHLDASRSVMANHMSKGRTLAIIPGGEAEALRTRNGREAVVLEGRKGFVALALQYGVSLVPTYTFGNVDTFRMSKRALFRFRNWLQRRFKVSIPIFWGVGGSPLPFRNPISLAVGKPIPVPPNPSRAKPSEALVDEYHAKYVAALQALFEQHKAEAGYAERTLEVLWAPGTGKARGRRES